jgi:predicted phosphohydrolase
MLINYKNNKIFVFSDSHGLHKHLDIPQDTDITICLGDAVEDNLNPYDYDDFLNWFSAQPGKKFFLPGNHELIFEIAPEWGKMLFKSDDIKLCLDSLEVINGISFYFQASNFLRLSLPKGVDMLLTHYPPEIYEYVGEERPERHLYGHIHESEGEVYASDSTIYNNVCCYNHCKEALREKIDNSIRRVRAIRNKRRNEDVQRTED